MLNDYDHYGNMWLKLDPFLEVKKMIRCKGILIILSPNGNFVIFFMKQEEMMPTTSGHDLAGR